MKSLIILMMMMSTVAAAEMSITEIFQDTGASHIVAPIWPDDREQNRTVVPPVLEVTNFNDVNYISKFI